MGAGPWPTTMDDDDEGPYIVNEAGRPLPFVPIARVPTAQAARELRATLLLRGVDCVIPNEDRLPLAAASPSPPGPVLVCVWEADLEYAREILAEPRRVLPPGGPQCPRCGSAEVTPPRRSWMMAVGSALLLGFVGAYQNLFPKWGCSDCGHRWPDGAARGFEAVVPEDRAGDRES